MFLFILFYVEKIKSHISEVYNVKVKATLLKHKTESVLSSKLKGLSTVYTPDILCGNEMFKFCFS